MTSIENLLTFMGGHFGIIAIGCIEVLAAVFLIGIAGTQRMRKVAAADPAALQQIFLQEFDHGDTEVCILIRREDYMPIYAQGNLEKLLNVSLKELQDDITVLRNCVQNPKQVQKFWKRCRTWDGHNPISTQVLFKGGRWVQLTIQRSGDGQYDLFYFAEITNIYGKLDEYEKRLIQAEEESKSKTSFLYRMSHEIRTPMNGIMGMLTLAKDTSDQENAQLQQYLSKAEELSEHLLSLINDILDMSRIEADKVELEARAFSLHAMGDKLYDMFAQQLENRGIFYAVNFEDVTEDWLIGDELRISQVLINFLSNAVKFTTKGEITVTFRQMMIQNGKSDLMISVRDTGKGMEPEFVNRIFRPFEQENNDIARNYGGTGLGMAITDNLVKLMKGEIVVKSIPGEGSEFSVFLTLPISDEKEAAEAMKETMAGETEDRSGSGDENAFRGKKILMAEDNEINAMIATEIMEQMGAEIDVAGDGRQVIDKFKESEENYYDFILMDVQMPVINGRDAARAIRKLKRKDAADIPIFALSADAFIEDERKSLESGMNGHFAKPVDFDELQKHIGEFLRKHGQ